MAAPLSATEAKTMNHLENMEGWRAQGYVPSNRSGVTIGYGIDLSQPPYNTEEGLRANGFSEEFISKAVELGVLGKDAVALGGINKAKRLARQLTISDTEEEKVRQFRLVQEKVNKRAEKYNGKMDEDAFISYKTLNHWSGGGLSKEQRDNISERDLKRGIRDPYTRKAYVAGVIEDELDRIYKEQGYVTNEQYQAAILKGKNSVPKFERNSPLNSRTLDREIEMVSSNSNTSVTNDNYEEILSTTPPSLPEVEVGGGRVISNLDPVAEGEEIVEEIYASDNTNENIEEFERYTQTAYGDGYEVRQKDGRMVIVEIPVPEGEPEPTPNYEEVENVDEMNYTTYVNQGRTIEPTDPPQPQVLDADGNIVDQPTADEGEAALRAEKERQRQEEEAEKQKVIIKRGNDAKEYQELMARNKQLRAAYKPEDMPASFAREIRNNEARLEEIETEYNLTRPTDDEYEERRVDIVTDIVTAGDELDDQTEEQVINDLAPDDTELEDIGEEEIIVPEGLGPNNVFYQDGNSYQVNDDGTNAELIAEGIAPTIPENAQPGDLFGDDNGHTYEVREDGTILYISPTVLRSDEYANRSRINGANVDDVLNNISTPEPTLEDVQRRHGPDARINNINGVPHVVYTDENGDPKDYRLDEFNSEENLQTYRLQDRDGMPPGGPLPIGDQPTRQDNTAGPTITPVEPRIEEGEEGEDIEAIDPTFIPNDDSSLVTNTNDSDGDGVPNSLDPDSENVEIVNTDFTNNQTNNEPVSFMDSLGDIGKAIGKGLGLVQQIQDTINGQDDLVLAALGQEAYKEALKETVAQDLPSLSPQFKKHLAQVQNLSKQGFSVEEAQKARQDIDIAYKKGLENAVRGTAGNRAQFLAMSGVLDENRSSALLEFAAKDAELNRQNQAAYTNALNFAEEYELQKSTTERSQQLQIDLQRKKGASEFAKTAFESLSDRMSPAQNQLFYKLQDAVNSGANPYVNFGLTTPGTTGN